VGSPRFERGGASLSPARRRIGASGASWVAHAARRLCSLPINGGGPVPSTQSSASHEGVGFACVGSGNGVRGPASLRGPRFQVVFRFGQVVRAVKNCRDLGGLDALLG
jgi:hypothetical protein